MIHVIWSLVAFPFRLLALAVEFLGRFAALALGFTLMVAGGAISAGSLYVIGLPIFLLGLLLTLRALG